jgi:hypothetical protein
MLSLIKNKNKHKWFNRTYWSGFSYASLYKTKKHCKAIGDALRNKKRSGEALDKCRKSAKLGAEARRGMKDTEEVKRKRAESVKRTMNDPEFKQKHYYSIYVIEGTNYVEKKLCLMYTQLHAILYIIDAKVKSLKIGNLLEKYYNDYEFWT